MTASYDENIKKLGIAELDNPDKTNIYLGKGDNLIQVDDENLIEELENKFAKNYSNLDDWL